MRQIAVIFHNIRSSHNVGALLRTADGLGIQKVYFSGFTPYPLEKHDSRLPYLAQKVANQINKTALGAAETVNWSHRSEITDLLDELRSQSFQIVAFEQSPTATPLNKFKPSEKLAIIFGNEVNGLDQSLLDRIDIHVEIPMLGRKESFNVTSSAAMCLYYCRWI